LRERNLHRTSPPLGRLDFSNNRTPATSKGYSGKFPKTEARYVRIHMLKNSANPFVHIVELIVDELLRGAHTA
jgi:hypothetical protein